LSGAVMIQAAPVSAEEAGGKKKAAETPEPPLHVTSDKMVAEKAARVVTFTGNVIAERENSTLNADQVEIFFAESSQEDPEENTGTDEVGNRKVEKIIATGHVVYTSEQRKAFADKAVYTAQDETLVLTGEAPRLTTENSFIEGEKITLYQKTDQVVVERGDNRRVNALLNPKDTNQKQKDTKQKE